MTGGTISGNTAKYSGVFLMGSPTFKLSGTVDISGNGRNVVLQDTEKIITIAGALNVDVHKPTGVSYWADLDKDSVDFTNGFDNAAHAPDKAFVSEQAGYAVLKNDSNNEAMLAKAWTVTFDANEGTGEMKPLTKQAGMAVTLTANAFTRTGYRFTGWNTAADGSGTAYTDGQKVTPTANLTLYAQWQKNEVEVEAFDAKGYQYTGKAIEPEVVVKDKKTGKALVKGTDYEVEYRNNVNAGDPSQAYILMKGDYEGVDVPVKGFRINPKPFTIKADNLTKVEGDKDPELTYTVDGLVEGDAMKGALAREAGEDPGTYKITKGTLTAGSNYDIVKFTEGTLTITGKKAEPTTAPEPEGDIETMVKTEADVPEMEIGGLTKAVAADLASKEEMARVDAGEKLVVFLTAANIDDTVSATDKALVTATITAKDSDAVVAQYLDFSMYKKVGSDTPTQLTDLKGHKITITITVPNQFRAPAGVKRTFYIVRVHDGEGQIVGSGTGASIKVSTDKFSTYALTYVDEVPLEPEPEPVVPDVALLARMTVAGSSKTALKIAWTKIPGADGYDVYFVKCGRDYKSKPKATVTGCSVKVSKLKARTEYKAYVRAWMKVGGKKVYLGDSPELHAITGGYDAKYCNAKSVKLNKSAVTLKVGKTTTVKATVKGVKSGKKLLTHVRKVRYYSSNINVATVNKSGKIKATGTGKCTIWAIANNGVRTSVKVTVK